MSWDESLDRAQRSYDNQSDDRFDDEDIELSEPIEDIDEIERLFVVAKKLSL